jgi:hypothetical protein
MLELQSTIGTHKGRCFPAGSIESVSSPLRRRFLSGARWDWWSVGGRWTGTLKLKPEYAGYGANGAPGFFTETNTDPQRADIVLAGWVDWATMRQDQIDHARADWTAWQTFPPRPMADDFSDHDAFKEAYRTWLAEVKKIDPAFDAVFLEHDRLTDLNTLTLDAYVEKYGSAKALTFAYINTDGAWRERAKMGWFAMTRDPNDQYDAEWWAFVESLPATTRLYLVDCHI